MDKLKKNNNCNDPLISNSVEWIKFLISNDVRAHFDWQIGPDFIRNLKIARNICSDEKFFEWIANNIKNIQFFDEELQNDIVQHFGSKNINAFSMARSITEKFF